VSLHRLVFAVVPALLLAAHSSLARTSFPELEADFAGVCQTAFERARQPYVEAEVPPLLQFDPPATGVKEDPGLVYEEYNQIKTLNWLYNDRFLWVTTRPRGNVHQGALDLWVAPGVTRPFRPGTYRLADYDYQAPGIQPPLPTTIPDAARVIAGLEFGAQLGRSGSWPQYGYLGPSAYLRLAGLDTGFGTSLRLGAYDVGWVESKPHLTRVQVRPLGYRRLGLLGVIEAAPFTACMQSVTTADLSTRIQTTLRFYPRAGHVGLPGAKVSPLAMSSMFWKGEAQTPDDPADEAHDADAMIVCGQDAAPLQGFIPNPGARGAFRDFGSAPCFGLIQRDRVAAHYATYAAAKYAERVNFWVDDIKSDLAFSIKLMAYGTEYEGEDNVVAYAEFLDDLPVPLAADDAAAFSYTLTASALPPPQPGPRIVVGDASPGALTGAAVAVSGDTLAVGAPVILGRQGSVYLFRRSPLGLIAQRRLTPDDSVAGDHFGAALAMSGDSLAVAAPAHGAVYVFVRRGRDWVQQAKLAVPVTYRFWALGYPVAIADDTLAVGVPGDDGAARGPATDFGAVYVFRRHAETWTREAILRAADGEAWDHFGQALALEGDRLAIGAPGDDYPQSWEQGSVYLFQRTATAWSQTGKLTEPGGWKDYGAAVALSGARLLVGVPRAHGNGWRTAAGALCAYARNGDTWSLQECLRPDDGRNGDEFGAAVSLSGRGALIGAPQARDGQGATYAYRFAQGQWTQDAKVTGDPGARAQFGAAVATDGATRLIGAPPPPGPDGTVQGAAYAFPAPGS